MTAFLALMSFTITVTAKAATINEKVLKNEQTLQAKANQSDVDRIYTILERLENKIDKLNED